MRFFSTFFFRQEPSKVKYPMYIEKDQCIPFDAGLMYKIKRQIIIRIHALNVTHTFESDLDALKRIADGHRHRVRKSNFETLFLLIKTNNQRVSAHFYTEGASRSHHSLQRFVIVALFFCFRRIFSTEDQTGRNRRQTQVPTSETRFAERRQRVYKHFGHEFLPKVFKLPVFCSVCSEFLW